MTLGVLSTNAFRVGMEDVDENETKHRRRLSSREQGSQGSEGVQDATEDGFETLGEFVQAGATGAKRKLMSWKVRAPSTVRFVFWRLGRVFGWLYCVSASSMSTL